MVSEIDIRSHFQVADLRELTDTSQTVVPQNTQMAVECHQRRALKKDMGFEQKMVDNQVLNLVHRVNHMC